MSVTSHPSRTYALRIAIPLLLVVSGASARVRAGEGDQRLDGRWRIVQMVKHGKTVPVPTDVTMEMSFSAADHKWRFVVKVHNETHEESGTWELKGSILTTWSEQRRRVEHIKVSEVGHDVIELAKPGEKLVLERI